jgi:hypothetical protein
MMTRQDDFSASRVADEAAVTRGSSRRSLIILAVLCAVLLVATAWMGSRLYAEAAPQKPVSQDDATAFVDNLVDVSLSTNPELVCVHSIFPNRCLRDFADNKSEIPTTRSVVECTWRTPGSGGDWTVAVRGTDGAGEPFVSYLVVTREDGYIVGSDNVYWYPFAAPANASGVTLNAHGVLCK